MCDHKYNITIHLHPSPIPPFYSFPRNTHKYTKPALHLLCVDVHWSWAAKWSQTMSRAATSLTPFTNRQHSLGAGPTVTLRRRYSSYLALFVSLYSFFFFFLPDSLTDRRRLGSCFLRLISSSFLSSTVSRSSFERKKRETEKIFLCEKKGR